MGGIIGDEGLENIKLSNDGLGKVFFDFQRTLLGLYNRGILLAICSKNTEEIAIKAIEEHPYMVLNKEHFAAMRINWDNKVKNIKKIAQELNIGLDSLVFLDDSDFEREMVRQQLPEVTVPQLPEDFADYPEFLMNLPYFDFTNLTFTDRKRNRMYKDNKKREKLKDNTGNIEQYYNSLNMEVEINKVDEFALPRVAQLTQKTNQFNLTTKRYTANDIEEMKESENYTVYYLELEDKFGSTGIVGVAIVEFISERKALIDSFILSCRVMGRTVETAFLAYITKELADLNFEVLYGEYFPTKKNKPVSDFYAEHDFEKISGHRWEFNLSKNEIKIPRWITVK